MTNKKTIWITGGSTGIGKALAIKFANEGWNVACLLYTSPSPRD